jgi:hypothetical protein
LWIQNPFFRSGAGNGIISDPDPALH